MLKYLKKYWYWCLLAPVFMFGEIAMDLIQPKIMSSIVNDGVLKSDVDLILDLGIRMILLVLFGGLCGTLCGVFANFATRRFGNDVRKAVFSKIMNLSFSQTDRISTGSLITRLSNDVNQVEMMVMLTLRMAVRSLCMFIGGIYMLYRISTHFALLTIGALPFVMIGVSFFLKKATPMFAVVQKKLDQVNHVMQEDVAGARVVKAYVREEYELNRFDKANDDLVDINLRVQTLLAFMMPYMNIILNLVVILLLYIGAIKVKDGAELQIGDLMAALTYVAMILHSVTFVANIFQSITRARASVARLNEVLDCPDLISDGDFEAAKALVSNVTRGTIRFEKVSFAYPSSPDRKVLEDIDLEIRAGETFAILGTTGSGKTSFVNLIPRFYDVTEGNVYVDGINVKDYELHELRERVVTVMQKAELYSRSIRENIRWGREDATDEEIYEAARVAQADDFIRASKDGYDTHVTESGHSLSGGQKQRISIARALVRKGEILIFDDATSALDLKTEAALHKALNSKDSVMDSEYSNMTKIIIAQRIASVRNADRIMVLDRGKILAIGTHDELMKSCDLYQDIYRSQLKDDKKGVTANE
jgi:ATP-binding cassette subfamily B protein